MRTTARRRRTTARRRPARGRRWLALPPGMCLALLALLGCARETDALRLVGTVERTQIELVAPISETIVAIDGRRGARVEPGQAIVQLDPTFARAEVARAEAALAGARTGEAVARDELARVRRLRAGRVASQQDLDRARLGHDEARARLREAEARLDAARKHEADLTLASPVAGVLDQLAFDPGERVPAGAVVAVVLSDAPPWIRVWVPETHVAQVVPGTAADVHVDGVAEPLHGSVLDVAREPEFTPHYALTERDRVHLVYETRVEIEDAPPRLRPGIPAQVRIAVPSDVAVAR